MNFLVAPCAYKGTYSPIELAKAIESGINKILPGSTIKQLPLADGGDGTIESLHYLLEGKLVKETVIGPGEKPVTGNWLQLNSSCHNEAIAIVELASVSGINHLEISELNPLYCHTRGLGQVLLSCLKSNAKHIYITVGGSASTDGGTGILAELGYEFLDKNNKILKPCGANLSKIISINSNNSVKKLASLSISIVTDVNNPLFGKEGAAYIYAPQKGADPKQVEFLDKGLRNFARVLEKHSGKSLSKMKGAGAAGGVPFGLGCLLDAKIINGFNWYSSLVNLESHLKKADIVITAEGYLDSQTLSGKAIGELAQLCKKHQKTLWALPAKVQKSINWSDYGIARVLETSTNKNATLTDVTRATITLLKSESNRINA